MLLSYRGNRFPIRGKFAFANSTTTLLHYRILVNQRHNNEKKGKNVSRRKEIRRPRFGCQGTSAEKNKYPNDFLQNKRGLFYDVAKERLQKFLF